jgi:hypothetical protein
MYASPFVQTRVLQVRVGEAFSRLQIRASRKIRKLHCEAEDFGLGDFGATNSIQNSPTGGN